VANAQELNCQVRLISTKATNVDPKIFKTLENAIKELMNTRKWTDVDTKNEERLECNITITIQDATSLTDFKADFSVQASRPVYKSNYQTVLFTYIDRNVPFSYDENTPLEFNELAPSNNLSSVLCYYALVALAFDADSFAPLGGVALWQRAQNLINSVPTSFGDKAWKSATGDGNRSRFWITESMLNPRAQNLRKAYYDYHIKGLDLMYDDPATAQINLADAIQKVGVANQDMLGSMALRMFADAKGNEIVQMFSGSRSPDKAKIAEVMKLVDGSNASKYLPLER
jgi:hypothetical protein